ncbi:hypothetical protein SODALDRAFT_54514 [Sodiomyces alkalinus F11]|uniref:EXPERA domain-containing protein n=1 Tax=Sodiomyces alkalinus (strain CBS 110278 / VKM F-3762 / F11) TaxID=1314773 RepID=A0A3N2PN29_SODAK|nr:hypothetical protein SODALDRAFT_54514 [Sodiomyces alkalinus F11]ROT35928.1 hypothetical protein SODALDRAFT_54514 [Sodiomyces alkalinus F11]
MPFHHHSDVPPSQQSQPQHPYYPIDVPISHFRANETDLPLVLAAFGGIVGVVVIGAAWIARRTKVRGLDRFAVCWFALSGFLHCFFEGYFIWNHSTLAGLQSVFGQAWKEYALSDSRYLTSDPFMLCVESITVVSPLPMGTPFPPFTPLCPLFPTWLGSGPPME